MSDDILNMEEIFKWIGDAILSDWAVRSTIGIFVPGFIFFMAWVFGKERTMKQEKRKFFIGGLIVIGLVLYCLCGVIINGVQKLGNQNQTPNFHTEIVNCQLLESATGSSELVFILKIVNSGSQSAAWKWHVKIDLVSGQSFEADATVRPSAIFGAFISSTNAPTVLFPTEAYLPSTLLEMAVPNGYGKRGWVGFDPKDISNDDIKRMGNKFTISFQDCNGQIYKASGTINKKVVDGLLFGQYE